MRWRDRLTSAPERCGVYLFKRGGKTLYVGKAKNLKRRLLQHLRLSETDVREAAIIGESTDIEWIVTESEFEALVLEIDLIQLHKPKFNILHKYGGGYPMLLLTEDPFPTVRVVRGTEHRGVLFGPFLQSRKAHRVKRLIHRLFRLRTCDPMPLRNEPCMDYHLGLCSAPCAGLIEAEEYALNVASAKALLSGQVAEILPELYRKIEEFSSRMMFEKCAQLRDQIEALENMARGQAVSALPFSSADLFYRLGPSLGLFLVRGGKLLSKRIYSFRGDGEIEEFVLGYYCANQIPEVILTNFPLSAEVKRWIKSRKRGEVKFLRKIPSKLEDLARENLGEELNLSLAAEEFEKKLGIGVPEIIEGFDVSHFQGEGTVGSCVVWERGRMNKKRYRKYRIRQSDSGDDYASLREILSRRAKRLRSGEEPVPDLWLLDGGPGQLNVGVEVRDRFGLKLKVMALAKGEEILLTEEGREVKLREEPLLYRIFGLVRDEAHRFALSYSRKLRAKSVMEDVLSKVRGVGDVRRRIIYRNFESLYDLLEADEEQLRKLGLPSQLKQEVRRYLKPFKD